MAQVLVRGIDDGVASRLKARARRSGRSFEAEVRLILQQASLATPAEFEAELADIHAMLAGRTFSDSVDLIREDRER